ncbi:MAG: hypothetical protein ACXWZS_04275 [Gemmatirosa sp.]
MIPFVAGAIAACDGTYIEGPPTPARVTVTVVRSVLRVGDSTAITAFVLDRNGKIIQHARRVASFRSSDTGIAIVLGSGVGTVRGLAPGSATIVAESGGRRDSVIVRVTP